MSWSDGLSGSALNIAATKDSPLRVMAGPGTGKSFSMKRRVARWLEEGVDPKRILAVTFTRNAAALLIEDLHALKVPGCDDIWAGTLHSFCFSLLGRSDVFAFLDRVPRPIVTFTKSAVLQFEGRVLLNDLAGRPFGAMRECTKRIRAFEAAWARLQSDTPGWPVDPVDKSFHVQLISWLKFHRAILIGELIPEALRFLRNNPTSKYRNMFDHVVVDECQDLNRAEQELVDLLGANGTTSIVGDVDQSIYSFRHANPEGIENFGATHPHTHDEPLVECRRCPTLVVELADHLICHNHLGHRGSRLHPMPGKPTGVVHIVQWKTIEEETRGLANYVNHLISNNGFSAADFLILTPRRMLGYAIRDHIRHLKVQVHSFYHEEALEAEEAQIAFSLFSLLVDSTDRVALRWWLGQDSPSGRRGEYKKLRQHCELSGLSPWETLVELEKGSLTLSGVTGLVARFRLLQTHLGKLRALSVKDLVDALFPDHVEGTSSLREAALLAMKDGLDVKGLFNGLRATITQPEMPQQGDFVRVMSLHKSKGLKSRVVIVAGCVQGLIPFVDADESPVEAEVTLREQRRLFYVAITRSEEVLILSSFSQIDRGLAYRIRLPTRGRGSIAGTISSQFLDEIGPSAPNSKDGQVWQAQSFID